jgi:type IV pilus assembly protein PilP
MIKSSSRISFFPAGGLLLFLAVSMPGCKKEAPPPLPPTATPLPAKTVQAPPAAAPAKPVQAAVTSARKTTAVPPLQAAVQQQITSAKRLSPPGKASLDFTSRRDPFKPFAQMPAQQPVAGRSLKKGVHDPLPIQRFDSEKFRVSGIVTGLKENSAIIIDPNNKGHVVREGMPLGNNDGIVKRITATSVEVEERFSDDSGRVRKRLVKLPLIRKK